MNIGQVSPLNILMIEKKQWREREEKKKRMNAGLHSGWQVIPRQLD